MTGSGTLLDPYVIWDVNDLQNVSLDPTAYYELGQDIDASATTGWNWNPGDGIFNGFDPLIWFTGSLDGRGYKISSLYINRDTWYIALFRDISGGTVQNVTLENVDITARHYVAALVGDILNGTIISNCHSSGSINTNGHLFEGEAAGLICEMLNSAIKHQITNCSSSCAVSTGKDNAGGLIYQVRDAIIASCHATGNVVARGFAAGFAAFIQQGANLSKCYAIGNVTITGRYAGGFASEIDNGAIIDQSYSTGDITVNSIDPLSCAGGFSAGIYNGSQVTNSYARGNVNGGASNDGTGGFVGLSWGAPAPSIDKCYSAGAVQTTGANLGGFCGLKSAGNITNCFWDIETSGQTTSDGGVGKTTSEMNDLDTFLNAGWDIESISTVDLAGGYPFLSFQVGSSPAWFIFVAGAPPVLMPDVITLPATEIH